MKIKDLQKQVDMFVNEHIEEIEEEGLYEGISENGKLYITSTSDDGSIASSVQPLNHEPKHRSLYEKKGSSTVEILNEIKKDKQIMMSKARSEMNRFRIEIESIDDVIKMLEKHKSQSGLS